MSKYIRSDDWAKAKAEFKKEIGNTAWGTVEDHFEDMDAAFAAMDEDILAWVEETRKEKAGSTEPSERSIHDIKEHMKGLMDVYDSAEEELEEDLRETLPVTAKNEEAIEDLMGEVAASEKFILLTFNQGIKILTGKAVKKKEVKAEIADLKSKLERTMFLGDGRWADVMGRADEKIKVVQRFIKVYSELPLIVQRQPENIRDLIGEYNSNLPNSGTGVRSVTTYMKGFLEMEYIFAAVDKQSSSLVKDLVPGKKIKSYDEYKKYLKVASRAIKVLSPWANAAFVLDPNNYVGMEPANILTDLRNRLLKCKKILAKLNSLFLKFN